MLSGGYLILTTPNPQNSKSIINMYTKGTLYAFQEKHIKEHHVFTPWEHIVCFFLESIGFEIIEYAIVDTKYRKRKPGNFKDSIKKIIENHLEKKNPKSRGLSYGLVARKL